VFEGEIVDCQRIARQTGILLDPIYTLAGWEVAERKARDFSGDWRRGTARENWKVVFLHTGGTLGLFGLAQRYPSAI
jgi:D-cysteine desulfhydrase